MIVYQYLAGVDVLNGTFNGTAPENCEGGTFSIYFSTLLHCNCSYHLGLSIHEYRFLYVGAVVTILTALFRLAAEIFQLCRHPLEYLLDWVNWLEIPLYLFSIMFTFVFATPCLCVYSWQWQLGVVAVFLGWVGLITFLQKWPVTGVYVLMFVNILGSFMKIAFLALLLVIAFALAFYMLLFDPDEMVSENIACKLVFIVNPVFVGSLHIILFVSHLWISAKHHRNAD